MNSEPGRSGQQQVRPPLSEAAKASLAKTQTLFRMFVVSVLGAFSSTSWMWATSG